MTTCKYCGLPIERQDPQHDSNTCRPCRTLVDNNPRIRISSLSRQDLELVLAWRSHPSIYQYFRNQTGPLSWEEHIAWFESREPTQYDFIIHYCERRVGVIGLNTDNEITIYIGDFSARNEGIATAVINWLIERFDTRTPLIAEVHDDNIASKQLFRRCDFNKRGQSDGWITYVYKT